MCEGINGENGSCLLFFHILSLDKPCGCWGNRTIFVALEIAGLYSISQLQTDLLEACFDQASNLMLHRATDDLPQDV